jgi:hypothetical protein
VDRRSASGEVKVADQIDIAPRDGRNAFENLNGVLVIGCKLVLVSEKESNEEGAVGAG